MDDFVKSIVVECLDAEQARWEHYRQALRSSVTEKNLASIKIREICHAREMVNMGEPTVPRWGSMRRT